MSINIGDKVKWIKPPNPSEETEQFVVTGMMNADRCFIELICDLPFAPLLSARRVELEKVPAQPDEERPDNA